MSYPTVEIEEKKIILLSGFERAHGANKASCHHSQRSA